MRHDGVVKARLVRDALISVVFVSLARWKLHTKLGDRSRLQSCVDVNVSREVRVGKKEGENARRRGQWSGDCGCDETVQLE